MTAIKEFVKKGESYTQTIMTDLPRLCVVCNQEFTPKRGGYNAKYCSKTCKQRISYKERSTRLTKVEKQTGRRKSYLAIKSHPDKYQKHLETSKNSVRNTRIWLANYKKKSGCIDCGYNIHPAALQLDHTGPKSVSIANARSSILRLQKEIEKGKCVVRCAICHAVKTWANKNGIEYKPEMAK